MQEKQKTKERKTKLVVPRKSRRASIIRNNMTSFVEHALEKARVSAKRHSANPFNLLPPNVSRVRKLERTCSTSAGSVLIQKTAADLAEDHMGYGRTNYTIAGKINGERMKRINHLMNSLESTGAKPNFKEEMAYILDGKSKRTVQVVITSDVYAVDRRGDHARIAAECKSPLANNDQAKAAKEKIFKLLAMENPLVDKAYFVLNYNPFGGGRENFTWSPPTRWFDIKGGDPTVLVGAEAWDLFGGKGTYKLLEKISKEIRGQYADAINEEFVYDTGITVPNPAALYDEIMALQDHFKVDLPE